MSVIKQRELENGKKIMFSCNENVVGVSKYNGTILITDNLKVVKYQPEGGVTLNEWRLINTNRQLTGAAVEHNERLYAVVDQSTIISWKLGNIHIDQKSKKCQLEKPCHGVAVVFEHLFVVYGDGSLQLLNIPDATWGHDLLGEVKVVSYDVYSERSSRNNHGIAVFLSDGSQVRIIKYRIQPGAGGDCNVEVRSETMPVGEMLYDRFDIQKPMSFLFLDNLQCVVYGSLLESGKECVSILNQRDKKNKTYVEYDSSIDGHVVQLLPLDDIILVVATKGIIEMEFSYRPALLSSVLRENLEADDIVEKNGVLSSRLFASSQTPHFDKLCAELKTWTAINNSSQLNDDIALQEFFTSSRDHSSVPIVEASVEEKLNLIPRFCRHAVNLNARVVIEMLSFVIELKEENIREPSTKSSILSSIMMCDLPDEMVENLRSMKYDHAFVLMQMLYDEAMRLDENTIEWVVHWLNLLCSSHAVQISIYKPQILVDLQPHLETWAKITLDCLAKKEYLKNTQAVDRNQQGGTCWTEAFVF